MDNPATESNAVNLDGAAALFAAALDPEAKKEPAEETQPELKAEETQTEETPAEPELVEVDIDGFKVQLPKDKADKLAAERLMQADYTRKTMAAADERKAAEAEKAKVAAERQNYVTNLARMQAQVEGALQEQQKTVDWDSLLAADPVEYLRQRHLAETRQAQLAQIQQARVSTEAQIKAEQEAAFRTHLETQQQALLAKLPEWRDEAKAKAEQAAIREFLVKEGYEPDSLNNINDARAVILARKAMLYDQMVSKASAAAKKVATLPTKVERPGGNESAPLDKRTASYQRLAKSGRVEDAASLFSSLL